MDQSLTSFTLHRTLAPLYTLTDFNMLFAQHFLAVSHLLADYDSTLDAT